MRRKNASAAKAAKRIPQISEAEWVVMSEIWQRGPLTSNQMVESLAGRSSWKPKTIHTLLRRLAQKGALAFERQGREYLFRPLVEAQACRQAAARSFLKRFFGGELAPFLAHFVEGERLAPEEIEELKSILDRGHSP